VTDALERGRGEGQYAIIPLPDGISPGPVTRDVSVADELAFDALPEEVRRIAERVVALRLFAEGEYRSYEEAYDDGYEKGVKEGGEDAKAAAEEKAEKEIEELEGKLDDRDQDLLDANNEVNRLKAQVAQQADEISRLRASLDLARKAKSA
jgi:flagellar biosynthesis/type III secretory pathway protein FliH